MEASTILGGVALAKEGESIEVAEEQALDIQHLKQHLDLLDQLITINITCPHCGKEIEVAMVGTQKPRR